MQKFCITIISLLCFMPLWAQTEDVEPNTLVVKTINGQVSRFNLDEIEELLFENEPVATTTVTRVLNLTPDFLSVSGIQENQELQAGAQAVITLTSGPILSSGFQDYHFEHIHLHVNDQVIVPEVPADYVVSTEMKIPFTVPADKCDIVVCYSGQQQTIDTGYTMALEETPHVRLYGVSPNVKYKYFDAYLLVDEAYIITHTEFKMGDGGDWASVEETFGCSLEADDNVPNLYGIKIRPNLQNVTGDVLLRVEGEQHHRYAINWPNANETYLDLEKSTLPLEAIDGNTVVAELYVNDDYYLNGATASDGTDVETLHRAYVRFTMPATDVAINLSILEKIPVVYAPSEHVTQATFYNQPDIYYGVPIEKGIPGEQVYIIATAEDGYKPVTATVKGGDSFSFSHYGLNMYLCAVTIPEEATFISTSIVCAKTWTVSSEQYVVFGNGEEYTPGETVNFAMKVPNGKRIDTVTAVTASGISLDVALDLPYGSFVMPAEDVVVTVTYADLEAGDQVSVIAYFNTDQYDVNSSTNYDWDFEEGFMIDNGATFYLSVIDYYGENFYVGVKIGETIETYPANEDEDSGEFSFGKALVANGDVVIKVGPTVDSVSF